MFRTTSSDARPRDAQRASRAEEGFTLAALLVVLTIMSIVVAYTVPQQWSIVMKRERDRQTIFLMKQYARAILNWQMKHANTAPTTLEQLHEARSPRMIRGGGKPFICPLTGSEDDWVLVPPQALVPDMGEQPSQPGANPNGRPGGRLPRLGDPVPGQLQPGQQRPRFKLNKELSPDDYKGPFVAVRPRMKGKSFLALNGAEDYSEWVYSVEDLRQEIAARQAALAKP
ncbi:MAG: type II secretion system GspH family protein [Acidobacteriota bacterium]|nr:type II secretion system GspH family protein [Acidobacteriota bacterium]